MISTAQGLLQFTGADGVEDWREFRPIRMTDGAVGYDVKVSSVVDPMTREVCGDLPVTIEPGGFALFGIGVVLAVPQGVDCQVRPRSGLATKFHITLANAPGTVDPDYRGEVACSMHNVGGEAYTFSRGDRIAQLVFTSILLLEFNEVDSIDDLPPTPRADGGFGSTGIRGSGSGTAGYYEALRRLDVYLMEIVFATARRSNCVRGCDIGTEGCALTDERGDLVGQTRRLGCVFAMGDKVVASGFNAQAPGQPLCAQAGCLRDERQIPSGTRLEECRAIHAEEMAILSAASSSADIRGCTMYCNAEPCLGCAKKIAGLQLGGLVILEGGYSSGQEGLDMVRSAGIPVRVVQKEWLRVLLD